MSSTRKHPLPLLAARTSRLLFFIALIFMLMGNAMHPQFEATIFTVLVGGIVLGVISIFGIKQCDKGTILKPALTGIVLNGMLMAFFAYLVLTLAPAK